jgi:hypothetical protein
MPVVRNDEFRQVDSVYTIPTLTTHQAAKHMQFRAVIILRGEWKISVPRPCLCEGRCYQDGEEHGRRDSISADLRNHNSRTQLLRS